MEYENQMFLDAFHDDGLTIAAKYVYIYLLYNILLYESAMTCDLPLKLTMFTDIKIWLINIVPWLSSKTYYLIIFFVNLCTLHVLTII